MDEEPKAPENENTAPASEPAPQPDNNTPAEQPVDPAPAAFAAEPAPAAAVLPNVPDQWPGGFGAYKFSKQAVKLNLSAIVILWIVNALIGGGSQAVLKRSGGLASLVLGALFTAALTLVYIASVRGQKLEVGEALSRAVPFWLKMIGLNLLIVVSLIVSILLLVVPFFFVLPRLVLAPYYLVDKNLGVMDAYKASWNGVKGHAMQAWGIIAMALLMVTIIGIPFAIYFLIMYSAALALFYEFLNKHQPAVAVAPVTPTPEAPAPPQAA
jgi:hypothetical protein